MPSAQYTFEAIGTVWNIDILDDLSTEQSAQTKANILARIEVFDKNYSRFRADSLVTKMAARAGTYALPGDAQPLLDLYANLYKITNGAVTPLIGQTLAQAGYDAAYSLKEGTPTPPPAWEEALEYDFPRLTIKQMALLDFGAAGKGYLVDIIGNLLAEQGVQNYYIDGGGDILYRSVSDARIEVALEHPADPTQAIGIASILNQSLCGSAGNRRAWGKYHHILNPHSLASPKHIQALWVTADNGLLADGLTTALFFTDADELAKHFDFEYAIVHADNSLEHSANFPADFFTKSNSSTVL
ncbi:MAG: FAD:protein transferase [Candidatus Saccharibacteria bacterium]|nr:FAD:protein transferase [Candidatus Saccharibacteria bacterium]